MSKYIDYDAIDYRNDKMHGKSSDFIDGVIYMAQRIEDAPSIDIVFCEKCRECIEKGTGADCPSGYGYLYCKRMKSVVDEDFYCGWGKHKDGE